MRRLILATLLLPTVALAQAPQQVTLTLTTHELAVVGTALSALPYRDVAPLIANIQRQIEAQKEKEQK